MNRLFKKISIITILIGLQACTEESMLNIEQGQLNQQFEVAGGIKYITVTSSKDFTAISDKAWCVPEIYSGGREYNLGIVVERNELADARTATVTVASDGLPELLISVSQTGAGPIITVAESLVMVDEENPEFTLEITANLPFTYELPDWIQPKDGNTPAIGTALYAFVVSPLPAGETLREENMTVKAADASVNKSATIAVRQTKAINPFEGVVGRWLFEDNESIGKAETGNDLTISESTLYPNGTTQTGGPMSIVDGPATGNKAVRIPKWSYFKSVYNMAPNGGGSRVNEYTMLFDFKVPALTVGTSHLYYTFFNTWIGDGSDGGDTSTNADFFIRGNDTHAIGGGVFSYSSSNPIEANRWYRLVVSVKVGETVKYYLDGVLLYTSTNVSTVDTFRASLRTDAVLFFHDDSGEDSELDVAEMAIWSETLDATRVGLLGKPQGIE
jgi:hypothetical protein